MPNRTFEFIPPGYADEAEVPILSVPAIKSRTGAFALKDLYNGSNVRCALLGNSKDGRVMYGDPRLPGPIADCWQNWANQALGSPFVWECYGIGGDTTTGYLARLFTIPNSTRVVMLGDAVNDVVALAKAANASTTQAKIDEITGNYQTLVTKLVAAGKIVIVPTCAPRGVMAAESNAFTDSRATCFDAVNAWIKANVPGLGGYVIDIDAILTDQTRLASGRLFKDAFYVTDASRTTVTTGTANTVQTVGTTTNMANGQVIWFEQAGTPVSRTIATVDSGTQITLTQTITTTTGEAVLFNITDAVHHSPKAGFEVGTNAAVKAAMRAIAEAAVRDVSIYDGFVIGTSVAASINSLVGTGGAVGGAGNVTLSGTVPTGFGLERSSGDQTVALTGSVEAYSPDTINMVGDWVERPDGGTSKWSKSVLTIPDSGTKHIVRYYTSGAINVAQSQNTMSGGINFGDEVFGEIELEVLSCVGLIGIGIELECPFTVGSDKVLIASGAPGNLTATSAVALDQGWLSGGSSTNARAGGTSNGPELPIVNMAGFRGVLRTSPVRIPENVTSTSGTFRFRVIYTFAGGVPSRAATIRWARPIWWKKTFSRQG